MCLALLASGCVPALHDEFLKEPRRDLPESYGDMLPASVAGAAPFASQHWGEFFADPDLALLVDTALDNNRELNISVQEILIAQAEVRARSGEYLPRVGAGAGAGVEKVGEFTSQGASDKSLDLPEPLQDYRFGFSASWEVDIWKKLRNSAKAATYRYLATLEGRNFLITQLVADIASSYYELIALDRQVEVLQVNIGLQQDALEVVRLEKQAGRVTLLAVQRFEAEVLKNQSRQYELQQEVFEVENRLNFLVGRLSQPIHRSTQRLDEPLPEILDSGVPSQLLENRPDVRQAELELAAAEVDVKVAKARFYPSLSIEGGVGFEAYKLKHLLDTPESPFFDVAAGLTAPLLNRRAIEADYVAANADQSKAILAYEQTILWAFIEVANQLALIGNLQKSYDLESRQVELLGQAIEVSNTLFQSARADYMEVLLTRRDSLEAQMDLIDTRLRQRQALVNVYQALGGGWR